MLSFNLPNWTGQILNNTASFKSNGNVGWLAGFWKTSSESNFMRASACLTSGGMPYVDVRAITQRLCKSWCEVYVPTFMQYTETYHCDDNKRGKKKKHFSIFNFSTTTVTYYRKTSTARPKIAHTVYTRKGSNLETTKPDNTLESWTPSCYYVITQNAYHCKKFQ